MSRRSGIYGGNGLKTLNDYTWDEIRAASDAGTAASLFAVGDAKAVVLNGAVGNYTFSNFATYAFIIGFDHNSTLEGTNRIHFQLATTAPSGGTLICFADGSYGSAMSAGGYFNMNTTAATLNGWSGSNMRNNILGTSLSSYTGKFIGALPSDLRSVMKSVSKYTNNLGGANTATETDITATTDYMFLPTTYELFGLSGSESTYEAWKQAQYSFYISASKIKYKHAEITVPSYYWTRSPVNNDSAKFVAIRDTAGRTSENANISRGISPCFCV